MKDRCLNAKMHNFKNYGARGIVICERWAQFSNFLEDMGRAPEKHTLERIDTNGNYEPSNCKWATHKEQENNRRNNRKISWNGKTLNMAQWATETGMHYQTLYTRIFRRGWSAEAAMTTPLKP